MKIPNKWSYLTPITENDKNDYLKITANNTTLNKYLSAGGADINLLKKMVILEYAALESKREYVCSRLMAKIMKYERYEIEYQLHKIYCPDA